MIIVCDICLIYEFIFNFSVALHCDIKPAIIKLQDTVSEITSDETSKLQTAILGMNYSDLNKILYRSDQEERDETSNRFGVYNVPGYGPLVYAGLQGLQYFPTHEVYLYKNASL